MPEEIDPFPPSWSLQLARALDLERQAATDREEALGRRCPEPDPMTGERCTADRLPEHVHRHRIEDLPR